VPARNVEVNDLEIGNIVTIMFANFEREKIPVNPIITKIRTDISWEDVVGQPSGMNIYLLTSLNNISLFCRIPGAGKETR
jgi:hypothetical protein